MARRTLAPALRRALLGNLERKGLAGRVRTSYRQYVVPGQPYNLDWNTDRAVKEGFEVNPWIYRAVHVIASAAVDRKIVLRADDPDDGKPIERNADPTNLLKLFGVKTNKWERAKIFRYRMLAQWLLSSRGVFVEVVRSRSGRVASLHLTDPDQVEIVPTKQQMPDGRTYVDPLGGFRVTVQDQSGPYNWLPRYRPDATFDEQPNSMLWLRSPHPTLMFRGMSPVQAAALSADLDRAARMYNRRFMDQDGRPGGILAVKGSVQGDTLERLEARFNGGPSSAGRTTAIQADDMEWADTSGNPRDTQWADTMDRMRREVAMVFGVPESVLGDASGRTFDNADAEYEVFWAQTMAPLLQMLDDQLDELTGDWDDTLYFRHDLSDVWVLGRHQRADLQTKQAEFAAGLCTLNEYLEAAGREPLDIPEARVYYLPAGKVVAGSEDDVKIVATRPMVGTPQPADPGVEAQQGAAMGSMMGVQEAEDINNARSLRMLQGGRGGALEQASAEDHLALEGKQGGARAGSGAAQWR